MAEIRGSVLSVEGRTVNGKIIFDVAFSDGIKYATFKQPIADAAKRLLKQPAVAQVTSKQKGEYLNHYLDSIEPGVGAVEAASAPIAVAQGGGRSPEVEQRIVRQNVIGTAFNFIGHVYTGAGPEALDEAKAAGLRLAKELYSHAFHGAAPVADTPAPTTAPEIAAQVNEVVGAPAVAVGAPAKTPDW